MDTTTLLILGGVAVVVVVVVLFALNRSWGNFPDRAGQLPPVGPSAPGASALAGLGSLEPELEPPPQLADAPEMPLTGGLVPIEHPLARRAAEQALLKGAPMARFIVRSGEQFYFSFDQISDPQ